jgi:hypothetical protein
VETIKSSDGTKIAFDRSGQGPPLILVGGAFSWRRWNGFVELSQFDIHDIETTVRTLRAMTRAPTENDVASRGGA